MKKTIRFLRLPSSDRRLLIRAAILVWAVRMGLWLLPFRYMHRLVGNGPPSETGERAADRESARKIAWAVKRTSRYVPAASCLTQAIATMVLLKRIGQPARLRIGVALDERGKLEAHAWVDIDGRILIGKVARLSRYHLLPGLEKKLS